MANDPSQSYGSSLAPANTQDRNVLTPYYPSPVASPTTAAIPMDSLTPTTPITLPNVPTTPDASTSIASGAGQTAKSLQDYIKEITPAPTAAENTQKSILDSIASLTSQDTGREQAQIAAEDASGATAARKSLTDINNELLIAHASYEKQFANLGGNGAVETSGVLNAQQAGLRRSQAADLGLIAARAQVAQGNLTLALSTANRAVDAKYADVEDQLKIKQAQLQALQPTLNKEEKLQAEALQRQYTDQQQALADKKAAQKENLNLALQAGISTKFVNKGGQFFNTADGTPYANPAAFFAAAGVKSFEEAYQKGLITDYTPAKAADYDFVNQARAKYPDAGILATDSPDQVRAKIQGSKIYRRETYIAPPAGSGGGGGGIYTPGANPQIDAYIQQVKNGNATLTNVPVALRGLVAQGLSQGASVVDPTTDAQVRSIIAANPGEYGHAADAINKIAPGLASKYDAQLRSVYNDKKNVGEAFNNDIYTPLAGSRYALEATRIAKNYVDLPAYVAASQAQVYLPRIAAAAQNPGSVGDAELLDSIVKLNTGGNAITQEQVHLITGYGSYADKVNRWKNQVSKKGGALSDQQRRELVQIAKDTNANYQKAYQPIYSQVTKQLEDAGVPQSFWTIPDLNALSNAGQGDGSDYESYLRAIGQ